MFNILNLIRLKRLLNKDLNQPTTPMAKLVTMVHNLATKLSKGIKLEDLISQLCTFQNWITRVRTHRPEMKNKKANRFKLIWFNNCGIDLKRIKRSTGKTSEKF